MRVELAPLGDGFTEVGDRQPQELLGHGVDDLATAVVVVAGLVHDHLAGLGELGIRAAVVAEQLDRDVDVVDYRSAAEQCGALARDLRDDGNDIVEGFVRAELQTIGHPLRERVRVSDVRTRRAEQRAARLRRGEIARALRLPAGRRRQRGAGRQVLLLAGPVSGIGRNERIGRHARTIVRLSPSLQT